MSRSLFDIPVVQIDGAHSDLSAYRGKTLLIVNVASQCGLTPQYKGLEALYQSRRPRGLEILGFPANNFRDQEPGSNAEIAQFCSLTYDVHFPLFAKISVSGPDKHPLYAELTEQQPLAVGAAVFRDFLAEHGIETGAPTEVMWNFEKFVVSRQGSVVRRFAPNIEADDPRLLAVIDSELAKP